MRPGRTRHLQIGFASWEVYEHTPQLIAGSALSLIFASNTLIRRLKRYPADWFELADAALIALGDLASTDQ